MNRYMIKVKEINTDCYCVDSETIEEAKDELMENFGDYCGNGMGEGSLEILEAEKVFTNIKQDKEGRILDSAEMILDRRKKLTKFDNQKETNERPLS
tara:strand:- start:7 stop:297 length:291 start_codon:yes stop_codon:yes gene_type:complete